MNTQLKPFRYLFILFLFTACTKKDKNQMQLQSIQISSYDLDQFTVDTFQQAELLVYVEDVLHARRIFQPEEEIPLGLINAFSEQTGDLSPENQEPFQDGAQIEIHVSWYSFYSSNNDQNNPLPSKSRLAVLSAAQAFLPSVKSAYSDVAFRNEWLEVKADLVFEPYAN